MLDMKISTQFVYTNSPGINKNNNRANYSCGVRNVLETDTFTPSFKALKKSMFSNFDFAVVEKFKSPIEKFKTFDDFRNWTDDEYFAICMKDFGGRTGDVRHKRQNMVCEWDQVLVAGGYTSPERLLIMNGITKDLKPNNDNICPIFNREVLAETLDDLKTILNKNKKIQFNFGKMYKENLVKMYAEHSTAGENESKWIIIPSKDNDPEHFKENIKKLQTLSPTEWCTKYSGAGFHLTNGDIHIYMVNGKPKVALRMNNGLVQEINGEHNDYRIPSEYVELTKQYLYDNGLITTEKADDMLKQSESDNTVKEILKNGGKGFFASIKSLFGFNK